MRRSTHSVLLQIAESAAVDQPPQRAQLTRLQTLLLQLAGHLGKETGLSSLREGSPSSSSARWYSPAARMFCTSTNAGTDPDGKISGGNYAGEGLGANGKSGPDGAGAATRGMSKRQSRRFDAIRALLLPSRSVRRRADSTLRGLSPLSSAQPLSDAQEAAIPTPSRLPRSQHPSGPDAADIAQSTQHPVSPETHGGLNQETSVNGDSPRCISPVSKAIVQQAASAKVEAVAAAAASSRTYRTLHDLINALGRGATPPCGDEIASLIANWVLSQPHQHSWFKPWTFTGSVDASGRLVHPMEALDALLLPHLEGEYGIRQSPFDLVRLLWTYVRYGFLGRGAPATTALLVRAVRPDTPVEKDAYWPTLLVWVMGRADYIAHGGSAHGGGGHRARAGGPETAVGLQGGRGGAPQQPRDVAAALVAAARPQLLPVVLQLLRREAAGLGAQNTSSFFWAAGRLGLKDIPTLAAVGARAAEVAGEMQPQNISNIIYGCAVLNLRREEVEALQERVPFLTHMVGEAVRRRFEGFKVQEMANAVWGAAKLQLLNRDLLAAASDYVMKTPDYGATQLQEWSNLLYAMALVDHYDARLFDKLATTLLGPGAEPLLATAGPSVWAPATSATLASDMPLPQPGAGADAAPLPTPHTLSTGPDPQQQQQQQQPESQPETRPHSQSWRQHARTVLRYSKPQACCNVLWAMGMLRHLDERVVDVLLDRMVATAPGVSSADLTLTMRALANLNYRPPALLELLEACGPRLRASPKHLMAHNMLWSLMILGALSEPAFQPHIRFLVSCVNQHGLHGWVQSGGVSLTRTKLQRLAADLKRQQREEEEEEEERQQREEEQIVRQGEEQGQELEQAGGEKQLSEQLEEEEQQEKENEEGRGGEGWQRRRPKLDARALEMMEDWNQLVMYHLESRRLGLTGPEYDILFPYLPGGMDELIEVVRAHRRMMARRARTLVVQNNVRRRLQELATSGRTPAILHLQSEVLLEPELMTVDHLLHLQAHPPVAAVSEGAAAAEADKGTNLEHKAADAVDAAPPVAAKADAAKAAAPSAAAAGADDRSLAPPAPEPHNKAATAPLHPGRESQEAAGPQSEVTGLRLDAATTERSGGAQQEAAEAAAAKAAPGISPPRERRAWRLFARASPPPHLAYPVVVEVDGRQHFMRNRPAVQEGGSAFRNRVLSQRLGGPQNVLVVSTDVWVMNCRNDDERRDLLARMLEQTVPPPLPPRGTGDPSC